MPWFTKTYGSAAIWSTQGMEKSHYQARGAYFCHTQHGGGAIRANSYMEVFYWFYRRIIIQKHNNDKLKQRREVQAIKISKQIQRRQLWKTSSAQETLNLWRSTRTRQSKVWIKSTQTSSSNIL